MTPSLISTILCNGFQPLRYGISVVFLNSRVVSCIESKVKKNSRFGSRLFRLFRWKGSTFRCRKYLLYPVDDRWLTIFKPNRWPLFGKLFLYEKIIYILQKYISRRFIFQHTWGELRVHEVERDSVTWTNLFVNRTKPRAPIIFVQILRRFRRISVVIVVVHTWYQIPFVRTLILPAVRIVCVCNVLLHVIMLRVCKLYVFGVLCVSLLFFSYL